MEEAWRRELYHEGVSKMNGAKIGSGRYPLGSGKRPRAMFRLFNKDKKPDIEKTYTDEEWAEEKRRAVDQGDVVFINKHKDQFTNREISDANSNYVTRKNLSNNASEVEKKNKKDIFDFLEKFNKKSKTLLDFVDVVDKGLGFLQKWANKDFGDNKKNQPPQHNITTENVNYNYNIKDDNNNDNNNNNRNRRNRNNRRR